MIEFYKIEEDAWVLQGLKDKINELKKYCIDHKKHAVCEEVVDAIDYVYCMASDTIDHDTCLDMLLERANGTYDK